MNKNLLTIEVIWWAITAIVITAVFWPIRQAGIEWPFKTWNIVFVVVMITLSRHILMLQYSLIWRMQIVKIVLILAMFPLGFVLIEHLNEFMVFADEQRLKALTEHLPFQQHRSMDAYLWNEMLFFGVSSIITVFILPVRLFVSVWRQHNGKE